MPKIGDNYQGKEGEITSPDGKVWQVKWLPNGMLKVVGLAPKQRQQPPSQSSPQPVTQPPTPKPQPQLPNGIEQWLKDGQLTFTTSTASPPIFTPGQGNQPGGQRTGDRNYGGNEKFEPQIDPVFKSRLSSVMTDNMYDRLLRNRKRGRLDMHHLHRAKLGSTNLFMQKQVRKGKRYNIVLVVDESGSMGQNEGSKQDHAANAAVFLAQHFNKLNLDVAVIGFGGLFKVHKEFHHDLKRGEDYKELHRKIMSHNGISDGDTKAFAPMKAAYEMFVKHGKTKDQNFVILISDGDTDRKPEVTQVVKQNEKIADTYGIGIFSKCDVIPRYITIDNVEQLKPEILKYLKEKIKRG